MLGITLNFKRLNVCLSKYDIDIATIICMTVARDKISSVIHSNIICEKIIPEKPGALPDDGDDAYNLDTIEYCRLMFRI